MQFFLIWWHFWNNTRFVFKWDPVTKVLIRCCSLLTDVHTDRWVLTFTKWHTAAPTSICLTHYLIMFKEGFILKWRRRLYIKNKIFECCCKLLYAPNSIYTFCNTYPGSQVTVMCSLNTYLDCSGSKWLLGGNCGKLHSVPVELNGSKCLHGPLKTSITIFKYHTCCYQLKYSWVSSPGFLQSYHYET